MSANTCVIVTGAREVGNPLPILRRLWQVLTELGSLSGFTGGKVFHSDRPNSGQGFSVDKLAACVAHDQGWATQTFRIIGTKEALALVEIFDTVLIVGFVSEAFKAKRHTSESPTAGRVSVRVYRAEDGVEIVKKA